MRVLKPTDTFILNIKEKAENGERHIYVIELILELRKKVGFGQRNSFGIKKIVTLENGLIVLGMRGNVVYNLTKQKSSICTRKK